MINIDLCLKNYRKTGDNVWFEKIYNDFAPRIFSFFYYKVFDRQLAEDLTSEVFIKVYKNLKTQKIKSKVFKVWIYKIAKNHFIDHYRKNKKYKDKIIITDRLESIIDDKLIEYDFFKKNSALIKKEFGFENYRLIDAMNSLTKLQKDVIILVFLENYDFKTIASIYGKSQSTIRGTLMRAINVLKTELNDL